ncbi:FKBP-type peptidyl-prolyl cis-trans isomerase [Fournierella massiliensis]|nr:FKBP-type peptidyl-prolyl cis-trans isomerase [Fournierella massiliensis]MCF2557969.1 FKBP-type peptidyl-prolyl cis-trans isomerase [Fournierella massiliensis]
MKNTALRFTSLTLSLALALGLAGCGGSSSSAASGSGAASSASSQPAEETESLDYSAGLDDNGRWEGITALDYVTLPQNYAAYPLPAEVTQVDDETIQSSLDVLPYNYATTEQITDRAVENGDQVNIDYVGSVDGVEFEGGSTGGAGTTVTAGSSNYIDDFLTQIIGHTPGETFNVEVTFPDPYQNNPDLAGKDAVFVTTINYIEETSVPELTDEFVAENLSEVYEGVATVEDVRAAITEQTIQSQIRSYFGSDDGFMTQCTFSEELPEAIIQYQSELCVEYYRQAAASNGMDFASFISLYFDGITTEEELLDVQEESILNATRQTLMLQAIAEAQDIDISDEDVSSYMSENMGVTDLTQYEATYGMPYLKNFVLNNEMLQFLADNAVRA